MRLRGLWHGRGRGWWICRGLWRGWVSEKDLGPGGGGRGYRWQIESERVSGVSLEDRSCWRRKILSSIERQGISAASKFEA